MTIYKKIFADPSQNPFSDVSDKDLIDPDLTVAGAQMFSAILSDDVAQFHFSISQGASLDEVITEHGMEDDPKFNAIEYAYDLQSKNILWYMRDVLGADVQVPTDPARELNKQLPNHINWQPS